MLISSRHSSGFTLIELLVSIAIGAMLLSGLTMVTGMISSSLSTAGYNHQLTHDAQFAMQQMVRSVASSQRLLLPLADNVNTDWPEHIREQTVPASPPIGSSTLATAVLAVTLPMDFDLNADGVPDADNDGDGAIDEDTGGDNTSDNAAGIVLIDDDGDGEVDDAASTIQDDDEDGVANEDSANGSDDDNDGMVDEDSGADMNNDADDGIDGVDDDGDGLVDESGSADDDEDGQSNEDHYDALVFYLDNGTLMQRTPVPWDESGDNIVDGKDYVVTPLAENVTAFRVERIASGTGMAKLIDLTLTLTHPVSNETLSLHTRVRLGKGL